MELVYKNFKIASHRPLKSDAKNTLQKIHSLEGFM
jgi:hypothetical protein